MAAVTALAGCSGDGDADPAPTTPGASSASAGPSPTVSSFAPTPAPSDSAAAPSPVDCSARALTDPPTMPVVTGVSAPAEATARVLFTAADTCDSARLITTATEDRTHLSFGLVTPQEAFSIPEGSDARYAALVRVLGTRPATDTTAGRALYVWPAVATSSEDGNDVAWQEVVDAGLLTPAEVTAMRSSGNGYLGWRVGIDGTDGTWQFMVSGD